MPATNTDIAAMSFEDALKELEQIVDKLEKGTVGLEELIAVYARGEALKTHCNELLRNAEQRIEKITLAADGRPAEPNRSTWNESGVALCTDPASKAMLPPLPSRTETAASINRYLSAPDTAPSALVGRRGSQEFRRKLRGRSGSNTIFFSNRLAACRR